MKNLYKAVIIVVLFSTSSLSYAEDYFKQWCDMFTAQGLVSLAANRIYGNISSLSKEEYDARSKWVEDAYKLSALRFKKITNHDFSFYEHKQSGNWMARCQLKDQIQ